MLGGDYLPKFKDVSGQRFGRLTALYRLNNYHKNGVYWLCVCDCGNLSEVLSTNLYRNHTTSCGCLQKDTISKIAKKHGKTGTKLYSTWKRIKRFCYNINVKKYKHYGGRGITMCDEWKNDFQAFYDWAMTNGYQEGLTIDRINVNGNYEPTNCRWATMKQQERNRTNNKYININGDIRCLSEWCETLGLKYSTVQSRLRYGWNIQRALELKGVVCVEC